MSDLVLESVAAAAAALDHARQQVVAGEIDMALSIAAMCDLHRVDETALMAGVERWVDGGADGTPKIGEFIAGEIAALLGISVGAAFDRIGEVLNLRHRHPTLWTEFLAGKMRMWEAVRVVAAARAAGLDAAACARFDRMCAVGLRTQSWQRVRRNITKWLIRADPEQARKRQLEKARDRYVHLGRVEHGHTSLWGQLDAADGMALDEALDRVADAMADDLADESKQRRRAAALGVMARSVLGEEALPTHGAGNRSVRRAELVIRVDASELVDPHTGVAEVDRWGAVLTEQVAELLAWCHVTVRPVVAGADLSAVDGYAVPEAMRLAVQARNPVDVFPYGVTDSWRCDLDHTKPFDHQNKLGQGQTRVDNLGSLSRFAHRLKTFGGWQLSQPRSGVFQWRSPLGYEYLTTAAGTIRTGPPRQLRRRTDAWSSVKKSLATPRYCRLVLVRHHMTVNIQ